MMLVGAVVSMTAKQTLASSAATTHGKEVMIEMVDTAKAILKFLVDEINYTAYEYSKCKKCGWQDRAKDLNTEGFILGYVLRESCELAGVKFEHHEAETGDLAFEVYSVVYPESRNTEATLQGLVDEYNTLPANAEADKDFVKKRAAVFKQILEICSSSGFMVKAEELDYLDGFGVICKRLSVVYPKGGDA